MDFLQTIIAVVVGALIAPVGSMIFGWWERGQLRRSVAAALAAEITATLDLIARREHVANFQMHLDAWRRGEMVDKVPGVHSLESEDEVIIYRTNLENLGLLGPELAAKVVRFYSAFLGIRGDIAALNNPGEVETIEARIGMVDIWRDTEKLGLALVKELR